HRARQHGQTEIAPAREFRRPKGPRIRPGEWWGRACAPSEPSVLRCELLTRRASRCGSERSDGRGQIQWLRPKPKDKKLPLREPECASQSVAPELVHHLGLRGRALGFNGFLGRLACQMRAHNINHG